MYEGLYSIHSEGKINFNKTKIDLIPVSMKNWVGLCKGEKYKDPLCGTLNEQ